MNLALDFDFIEKGSKQGLPKGMEWFAALALLVTLVWLYLEMLRLLEQAAAALALDLQRHNVRRKPSRASLNAAGASCCVQCPTPRGWWRRGSRGAGSASARRRRVHHVDDVVGAADEVRRHRQHAPGRGP